MLKDVKVKDVMKVGVITVSMEDNLVDVAKVLSKHRINGVGVVDENGSLEGVISDRDIIRAFSKGINLKKAKVKEFMAPIPITIDKDKSLEDAAKLMYSEGLHRLFVVEQEEIKPKSLSAKYRFKPVGIITSRDIVVELSRSC